MPYVRPVEPTNGRISSYQAHTNRRPPSREAGVDYYCPIGTPLRAIGDGVVVETGGSIYPATGRYTTVNLGDGRRFRFLHLQDWLARPGQRVRKGEVIALSGASGYGSEYFGYDSPTNKQMIWETGGPHVHATLWPFQWDEFGPNARTLDLEQFIGDSHKGGTTNPQSEEDEEMRNVGVYYNLDSNTIVYLIFNSGSGWYHEFSNGTGNGAMPGDYNNALATALGSTSWAKVTKGHADVIKESLAAVSRTEIVGKLAIVQGA